ncbi:MAG: glycyl-radical enzyme activating protein [bacterium]
MYEKNLGGVILGIGHGTMRDGPNWRSIIYFKGCNFRCRWCASPDSFFALPEILFFADRVKYPARVASSCPYGALKLKGNGVVLKRTACRGCRTFECANLCIDGSIELVGSVMTVEQIVGDVLHYRRAHADYGVTLSGGEPSLQWQFYLELLKAFKHHGLHTAVETNCSIKRIPESLPYLDLVICDLKLMDAQGHKQWTDRINRNVLRNIETIVKARKPLWVRIPVIPGINDGENIMKTIDFLQPMREHLLVELLGYHRLGVYKWKALGKRYALHHIEPPDNETIKKLERRFEGAGLKIIHT